MTPPSSPRKQRPQLKGIERILLVVQYPVVNDNVTTLLNSHPNLAIVYDSQLLDKEADVFYHNDSQVPQLLIEDSDATIDRLRRLSTQVEKKYVKVIGESTGVTLNNSKFRRTFQLHLKTVLNVFHLPVSVVFVNTAPLLRDQQAGLDRLKIMMARTMDVSVLTLDLQYLSPYMFMERVCTFLRLSCSVILEAVSW